MTDANFSDNVIQAPIRNELDFVDSHHYGDHPRFWRFFHQNSATEASALVPRLLFPDRIFGKPFTVTEINYTFPNRWRAESAPLLGSYAALQDWDALYRFAWGHSRNAVLKKEPVIRFDTVQDPVARFAEKIIVLMFRRGDVSPADTALAYPFGERDFDGIAKFDKNTSKFPFAFEKLGFYCRVGALPAEKKLPGVLTLPQRNWRATPMASISPASTAFAAVLASILPAQTTGISTNFFICATSSRLQFSGIYSGGCAQYQAS